MYNNPEPPPASLDSLNNPLTSRNNNLRKYDVKNWIASYNEAYKVSRGVRVCVRE